MKIRFIFKFSSRILIEIWKGIFICCVVGSPIFFVWGMMCLRFEVSGFWCVWGLTCLGFDVSGVVNGTCWQPLRIKIHASETLIYNWWQKHDPKLLHHFKIVPKNRESKNKILMGCIYCIFQSISTTQVIRNFLHIQKLQSQSLYTLNLLLQ